ncbi:MAG: D-alanyl-D-alanine carboxypeptidase family protein [Christensenellales bacterium]|jgi:D-alanyl-D-alanine carboxypeptidase (penicillin-binding protein 5/6)
MVGYLTVRHQKYVKKVISFIVLIALLSVISLCFSPGDSAYAASSGEVVMEAGSLRVLEGSNMHVRMPMASTTKAMTLLIAIEKGNLEQIVTIPKEAVGIEGSSIYLRAGEKLTLKELCYGLMLSSGNDAAVAIACAVGKSVEGFCALMNQRAAELGLKNTHFCNPHGLHDDNHYTSAYDLAVISCYGMRNPVFRSVVGTQNIKISGGEGGYRYLYNKNKILKLYKDGNGIKTGFTKKAGRCLIASSERDGMQLVCVLLNCPPMFERSMQLMDKAYREYEMKTIAAPNQSICGINIKDGTVARSGICLREGVRIPVKRDGSERISAKLDLPNAIPAPHKKEDPVGAIAIYINNNLLFTKKLYTMRDIKSKGVLDHFNDIIKRW